MRNDSKMADNTNSALTQLFRAVDQDNSGAIDEKELSAICPDLSPDEVHYIFRELDVDGDGEITMAEFSSGFQGIRDSLMALSQSGRGSAARTRDRGARARSQHGQNMVVSDPEDSEEADEADTAAFVGTLDDGFAALSCQEQVCDLYQSLHAENLPGLLTRFEEIILNVIRDIRQSQFENERLEKSFKREKETHASHLRQLEEEMEAQMQRVEARVRVELREKQDIEKEELQSQLEQEIDDLKANLKKLQGIEPHLQEKASEGFKARLEEVLAENRYLQSQLTDTQTALALVRSEMATVHQNYEEKSHELEAEKETLLQYIREQDNLTRQVHLLHDANKKLHDTNDDLRAALENAKTVYKRPRSASGSPRPMSLPPLPTAGEVGSMNPGDYVQQYLSTPSNNFPGYNNGSLADELSPMKSPDRRPLPSQESCEIDSIPEDFDSGHSTLRDLNDLDVESDRNHDDDHMYRPRKKNRVLPKAMPPDDEDDYDGIHGPEHENDDATMSEGEMETEIEEEIDAVSLRRQLSRAPSTCSQASSSRGSGGSRPSSRAGSRTGSVMRKPPVGRRKLPVIPQRPITGEPERMYKIVLCGDAAVGKSSFIMRLCKNRFVNNLSSTLGVDFQTKVLEVDGRIIALQLWDTAGQERFRSIAKSYFRRADGVLLLYDCTYERSFINIREWIDAVEDSSQKKIPLMIAGNKIDLRDERMEAGKRCVTYDDGHRLAREHDALFIETSAKDGDYVMETAIEFARLLRTQEDLEVKTVGMQLNDLKVESESKKMSCCN